MSQMRDIKVFGKPALLAGLCMVLFAGTSLAQEKKKLNFSSAPAKKEAPAALKKEMDDVRRQVTLTILTNGTLASDTDRDAFKKFFDAHVEWFKHEDSEPYLPQLRAEFRLHLLVAMKAPNRGAQNELTRFILTEMESLVYDEQQTMPVRVNALLLITELDQTPEKIGAPTVPAVPAAPALAPLMKMFQDQKLPIGLRSVALRGLQRHAESGVGQKEAAVLRDVALQTLNNKTVPQGCDAAGHEWFRQRATAILGFLRAVGVAQNDVSVFNAIAGVVNEKEASLAFRSKAACSLGRLDYAGAPAVGVGPAAQSLGVLALQILEKETDKKYLLEYLKCVREGLKGRNPKQPEGLLKAAEADAKVSEFIEALDKQLAESVSVISKQAIRDESRVPEAAKGEADSLKRIVKVASPKAKKDDSKAKKEETKPKTEPKPKSKP
jgi:hypothetical protein